MIWPGFMPADFSRAIFDPLWLANIFRTASLLSWSNGQIEMFHANALGVTIALVVGLLFHLSLATPVPAAAE
jgi:hypothetical protein